MDDFAVVEVNKLHIENKAAYRADGELRQDTIRYEVETGMVIAIVV